MGTAKKPGEPYFESDEERDRYFMDREERERTDRYGVGQSGYAAGRTAPDPSLPFEAQNQSYAGAYADPEGDDERFTGRGGEGYWIDRPAHEPEKPTGGQQGLPGYGQQTVYGYGQQGFASRNPEYRDAWSQNQHPEPLGGQGAADTERSDREIREDARRALASERRVDTSHVEAVVQNGIVFLTGVVEDRRTKKRAEAIVEDISGVVDVQNQLRIPGNQTIGGSVGIKDSEVSDRKHRA
jgi:hypothetical protein